MLRGGDLLVARCLAAVEQKDVAKKLLVEVEVGAKAY